MIDITLVEQQLIIFNNIVNKAKRCLSEKQFCIFKKYVMKLLEWNNRINLISKKDEHQIVRRHFLESIAVLDVIELPLGCNVVDIGTGGGLPGVPIKIIRPDIKLTLVDANRMKTLFLYELVSFLDLDNVTIIRNRAEQISLKPEFQNKYDFVMSRAVTRLSLLYQWTYKFLKDDGAIISFKSGNIEKEVYELKNKFKKIDIKIIPLISNLISMNNNFVIVQLSSRD